MTETQVNNIILRNIKEKGDWRHLQVRLDGKGDLLLKGKTWELQSVNFLVKILANMNG